MRHHDDTTRQADHRRRGTRTTRRSRWATSGRSPEFDPAANDPAANDPAANDPDPFAAAEAALTAAGICFSVVADRTHDTPQHPTAA